MLMDEAACPEAAAVNAHVTDLLNTYYTEEAIRGYFSDLGYDPQSVDMSVRPIPVFLRLLSCVL